ncbi:MAG TPA: ATP-binding protein [Noviherbaspirillum sp.]
MSGKQYSIRRRLVIGTLACMVLILGAIGMTAHQMATHESEEIFSARLATSARVLEALVARQIEKATITTPIVISLPRELEQASGDEPNPYGHPYETKIAFQVRDAQGHLLARSSSAPDAVFGPMKAGFSRHLIGGEPWEVFALQSGGVWIFAAEKSEVREEMASELGDSILAPLIIGGLLMLVAVNIVLSLNMTALRELADRISKREPESLAPIELPETPVELAPIVRELNELLQRVRAAFDREKRFIDAAAHEIRTPIAALQIHVQNALRAENLQERENSLAEALVGLRRTTNLAEQLLSFSRITAKVDSEKFQVVALDRLCRDIIAEQEPLLAARGQTIGFDGTEGCHVSCDPYKVQRLLQNLIENASLYGLPHGDIQVELEKCDGRVELRVANDGEPVPDSEVEKIFAPYYRVPGTAQGGSGLGLAIVKEIAEQHKARLGMRRKRNGQGTVVTVSFPEAAAPERDS